VRNYTFRLKPGQDLFDSISLFVAQKKIEAGCVLSGVGSLAKSVILFANQETVSDSVSTSRSSCLPGRYRSATRTCTSRSQTGRTIGEHFDSGCKIFTTAEAVIAAFDHVVYKREYAEDSGYEELVVEEG
jgi:predicted DNA-binding protein with PD1-like motif